VVLLCLLLPALGLVFQPVGEAGSLDLNRQGVLLARTLALSAGSALVALLLGAGVTVLLSFRDLPGRALWQMGFLAPLLVPPYLWALAWMRLGLPTHSPVVTALVLGACWYPLVTWPGLVAVAACPAALADAARLSRGETRLWTSLLLPMAAPFMLCGALGVFCLACVEYGVPSLLQVETFALEVFTLVNGYHDLPAAARASLAPLVGVLVVAGGLARFLATRLGSLWQPHGGGPVVLHLPRRSRPLALLLAAGGVGGLVALPLGVLVRDADRFPRALWEAGPDLVTTVWACALAALLALVLGSWLAAGRSLAVAGLALGLVAWPPSLLALGWGAWFGGNPALLPAGLAVRFLPLALLLLLASYRSLPRSLDEAALLRGGSFWLRFVQLHRPLLRVSAALVFALAAGDLTLGLLLAPPGQATLAVRIFNLNHYGQPDLVAALCLVQAGVCLTPMLGALAWNSVQEES